MPETTVAPAQAETLDDITRHARSIVSPEQAGRWASVFGLTLAQLQLEPRKMGTFYRATYRDADQKGIAVHSLAVALARALGCPEDGDPYATPYSGTGRSAALFTRRAVNRIRTHHLGLPPLDEHAG